MLSQLMWETNLFFWHSSLGHIINGMNVGEDICKHKVYKTQQNQPFIYTEFSFHEQNLDLFKQLLLTYTQQYNVSHIEYKTLDIENFSRLLPKNISAEKRWWIGYFSFLSSTLSHKVPAKKASPIKAGSHNLYYHMNDLIAEKNPNPVMT